MPSQSERRSGSHLPAEAVTIGTQRRQVCRWCGTTLESIPLLRTYMSDGNEPPTFSPEHWYGFDGPAIWMASPAEEPPDDACCRQEGNDSQICGRLLVGQGNDTYDPLCVMPPGHDGKCEPESTAPDKSRVLLVKASDAIGPAPVGTQVEILLPLGMERDEQKRRAYGKLKRDRPHENPMCWTVSGD